ncbi:MAG: hypothetical protein R3E58_05965 [Phycisphaerae bacterium]
MNHNEIAPLIIDGAIFFCALRMAWHLMKAIGSIGESGKPDKQQ